MLWGAVKRDVSPAATFQLYAYGEDLSGFPLFYADGLAYVGDASAFNSSGAAVVDFQTKKDSGYFVGNPNTTLSRNKPTWSNVTLFVPSNSSEDRHVGFLDLNDGTGNTTTETSGFFFYGSTAMHMCADGSLASAFFGAKVQDNVYELVWNETTKTIPLSLRRTAPSSPVKAWR
ncbi:cytochrome p450 [Pyrenophora seminiperda CCB06]|uniref:Cytochrome p450 n=1 Tax=Pyrenophora seminiperda CCB06 TaxID=1302712 RepID=A0A3M7M8N3_9PLEO|nr:cytochrome p450 [Pyrenophora seminiperda CCB06]